MCGENMPRPSDYMANLREPMPLGRKLRLIAHNTWRKMRGLKPCCGHHGEPGC
jgi:hypothetical protein